MARARFSHSCACDRRAFIILSLIFAFAIGAGLPQGFAAFAPDQPNAVMFPAVSARFVRLVLLESDGEPCIDELEVYGGNAVNIALASTGAKASASSLLPGYAIHQVAHLNDGHYGNSRSWIAATSRDEWAQIEFPAPTEVQRVVFSRDREGRFRDRLPRSIEVRVSTNGTQWTTVAKIREPGALPDGPLSETDLLRYAYELEDASMLKVDPTDTVRRVMGQMSAMLDRFALRGISVRSERAELEDLVQAEKSLAAGGLEKRSELAFRAHLAKRRLLLRDPDLAPLERIVFVKRHAYEPSHNYSDIFDSAGAPGGAICVLEIPRANGGLNTVAATVKVLFDARQGVARDPAVDFEARTVWFGYRTSKTDYYHLWRVNVDGSGPTQVSDGPFHDYYPCPLPDGGLAFMTTRCKARFLCWRPQAFTMFRMDRDGSNVQALSHANLSEWTPSLMRDGRLIWMRSEYIDKGANFGHTLWAIRPDGTAPELIFGNDTDYCYAQGREVPGSPELVCTLVSHGGDLNGPIALIDPRRGKFNTEAVTSLTPDIPPQFDMNWLSRHCFRDPVPVNRDYFLCSHAPADKFGLFLIDRWGNRELLYLDPVIGSMAPLPLKAATPPPVLSQTTVPDLGAQGQFVLQDVYLGLQPSVPRGRIKYLRVCQEVRSELRQLPNGEYQSDHEPYMDWYATPVHKVSGPHGWPSYVAKADLGLVPVEADGSANFFAPAGKVLYFEALDEKLNEVQRMRSVVQLQPGERRGCVGCHEDRSTAPVTGRSFPLALRRPASPLTPPPWGAVPFAYEKVVQPVWDEQCVRCHDSRHKKGINLTGMLDGDGVPASYRTLIERDLVHYFDWGYAERHRKAAPLTFGTVKSRLWTVLAQTNHAEVKLTSDQERRIKTWVDLNCPLWPDYQFRPERRGVVAGTRN